MVVVGQSGGIRSKVVVFGYKKLYSGKSGYIRAKVVVFGQKWLYSGKVVVFGQSGCSRPKLWYSGAKSFIWAKSL